MSALRERQQSALNTVFSAAVSAEPSLAGEPRLMGAEKIGMFGVLYRARFR